MLQVSEILNLSLFNNFELIAGKKGLKNELKNVVILEYESINNHYEVFSEGDFVLTSLFFEKDDPSLIEAAFRKLFAKKVCAIAVKTVFFKDIPNKLKILADSLNIPLFVFNNSYMEDLIICVNELLKSKQQYLAFEEKVNSLINLLPSPYFIEETAKTINPSFYENMVCYYITPIDSSVNIVTYFNKMLYKKYQQQNIVNYSYVKYKRGMLIIYSFKENNKITDLKKILNKLLRQIDINSKDFYIGISNVHQSLKEFDSCIKESIYANNLCTLKKNLLTYYKDLGIYKFLYPLYWDKDILTCTTRVIKKIKEYDKIYTSNLLETLISYVNNNGEISKTANDLFQHPNTIRYRLKKAQNLLGEFGMEDDFYEQIFIFIKIYIIYTNNVET